MHQELALTETALKLAEAPGPGVITEDIRSRSAAGVSAAGARPDFFIVGAPKCGTTAMSDYLATHPDIFMARKEMNFFGKDLNFSHHFYRRNEEEYLAEFRGWSGQRRTGEASVWYLFSETAIAELKRFNPAARVVVMLREPVQMMHSLFQYFHFDGNEPMTSFAEALAAETDRRGGQRAGRQTYFTQGLVYHEVVGYARQLERCYECLGRDRVHVVLFEDLAANPAAVYRDVLKFLEVDESHTLPAFNPVNGAKAVKSQALRAVLNDPMVRSAVLALRPMLPRPIFDGARRLGDAFWRYNAVEKKSAPLDRELEARLRHEFAPEVRRLGDLIQRDLSHWTREPGRTELPANEMAATP